MRPPGFHVGVAVFLVLAAPVLFAQSIVSESDGRAAMSHYRTAQELLAREQWEKAAAAFADAIKLDPLFIDAHYGRGQAFMGLQRYRSAIQAFEGALGASRALHGLRDSHRTNVDRQIEDEIRELRDQLRRTQSVKGGVAMRTTQLEERIRDLERQKSSLGGPFEAPAVISLALGSAYFRNGDRAEAEALWDDAVRVNNRLGEAWNNLAAIYLTSGRKKNAEAAVRNAERAGFRVNPRLKDDVAKMPP
jgi:tetratricopeptide (TPR) repeat protein